ncbi:MAG: glutamate synthase large subunit [Ardenticatenaceae bacterium]
MAPGPQGLYDPRFEHDACGIGFVAHIKGQKSNDIVRQALTVLCNLDHRGAVGAEINTGDGAGILMQLPDRFLRETCADLGIELPPLGQYGVGMIFLPHDAELRRAVEAQIEAIIVEEGQAFLGWRTVPTNNESLGNTSKAGEPFVRQLFVGHVGAADTLGMAFERKLYVIRRRAEHAIQQSGLPSSQDFYIPSLSSRTIVYKGMLLCDQVERFYPDLSDPRLEVAIAMVHSRFSTNTFPNWARAHPYRYLMHNGEINTVKGNVNWMNARQGVLESDLFADDLQKLLPIIDQDGSDSAMFDNSLEFLLLSGRSLPHAMMMMIPEPWQKHQTMDDAKKAFYEYHTCLMEAWDGPAGMGATDGTQIAAILDRNGLRPARYYVTKDDRIIMSSEVGVLDVAPENVLYKGRLQPGRMLLVDTAAGRIISDEELKSQIANEKPYRQWLDENLITLNQLPSNNPLTSAANSQPLFPLTTNGSSLNGHTNGYHATIPLLGLDVTKLQLAFGYTFEDLRLILAPMAKNGVEALGSMGDDTPHAVLSNKQRLMYDYFRQLFAQVTNPPLDAIREELVTSTETYLGSDGNLLNPQPEHARQLKIEHPILTNEQFAKLSGLDIPGFKAVTLDILYPVGDGQALEQAMNELFAKADAAISEGANLLILSDRGVNAHEAPIPALLAVSGLHHHLIRQETRTQVSLILHSGEPREVHHFACLIGYGADVIHPYLAFDAIRDMLDKQLITNVPYKKAVHKYIKAILKGVVKVCAKMGISTLQSYRGAQIFEALGLAKSVVDQYFTGTASRIEGATMDVLAKEIKDRHTLAFPERPANGHALPAGGKYQVRSNGEFHLFNPGTVHALQHACRNQDYKAFKRYSRDVNDQSENLCTLRSLLQFKFDNEPIPLDEVESVESICQRFKTGAMSYGSISLEAHSTLAIAMNRIGGKSNTGEGGESPERFKPRPNGDSANSAIKQVASGRFGVTSEYLVNASELQIKMAQGAKPGEGGQLPGRKVYPWIAKTRLSTPGVGLISPPPHHDIYSIEDLAQLIFDLKNANRDARINVKLVSEVGVGTIAAGVAKGHADVILISGHDGGTGASPQTSIKYAGLPWELGVAETHQTLLLNDLRSRVVVETDGQLKTGRDVVIAALLGAEEFGFATAPLISIGCIMMRVCQMNTCPVGVATQNPELRAKFTGDPQHVVNFMHFIAQEMREIMAELGFRTLDEMIGRTDKLEMNQAIEHWKARGLDFSNMLYQPDVPESVGRYCQIKQDHGIEKTLDMQVLLDLCQPALERGEAVEGTLPIKNINRTVGTILGSEVTRRYGAEGLPEDTIQLTFKGSAGQSFGAFVPAGITLTVEGDGNDYFGKGLSGGKIIVTPPESATFVPEENIIIGNVALYGATSGEAYVRGVAGERFCVRNSGVHAVVEGVGDHACEYMTGGRVVVLGKTGRNFAAGMSGGIAYVLDQQGDFTQHRCNHAMVDTETLTDPDEIADVKQMIQNHFEHTASSLAWRVLSEWHDILPKFVKIMPRDYRRMLDAITRAEAMGFTGDRALMEAFEANKRDMARISGN